MKQTNMECSETTRSANYSQIPTRDSVGTLEKGCLAVPGGRPEASVALQVSAYTATTAMHVVWRACNGMMSLFFGLATYVQINDPDGALWMFGYGVPAVLCALIGFKPHVTGVAIVFRDVAMETCCRPSHDAVHWDAPDHRMEAIRTKHDGRLPRRGGPRVWRCGIDNHVASAVSSLWKVGGGQTQSVSCHCRHPLSICLLVLLPHP
ncbi:transmembrane protein 220 isoform X2 [Syngnathoides biaculeatus]|uniref:transmembrane protein 220 isoform X2 n=1 Tax=Syngnathoides biaculeatus TaxID=300417 RepID=UPI002ADE95D6|nr:transmembrane protein 220 isoform X2 [Syngnathoides biaculeatus]